MRYIVYTDGSYSQEKKLGGGAYIILTETTYVSSDSISLKQMGNPTNTETVALGLAAAYLVDVVKVTGDDVVEFYTDCLSSVSFCKKNATTAGRVFSNNKKVIASIQAIRKLVKICPVAFEKVRAHKTVLSPNTVADRLAKLAIRRD